MSEKIHDNMLMDTQQRKIASKAWAIVHYKLNSEHWIYQEKTGNDVGRDCIIELSEDNHFSNNKIEGQIKGFIAAEPLKTASCFSFSMEVKTILYALAANSAFILFYVDVKNENVYYLPIQDYFIANNPEFNKLNTGQKTISVHIPLDNILSDDDFDLQEIAKSVYLDGPSKTLKKCRSC